MKICKYNTKDNQAYLYVPYEESEKRHPDPPRKLAPGWEPPTFELVGADEFRSYLPKTDFPSFTPAAMMLSGRAVSRLRAILDSCGEVLPIYLSNDRDAFYFFNVTRIVNAVDMQRSEFLRFPSGGVMKVERLVFEPSLVPDEPVFFKNTQMRPCTEIFATEAAVKAVEQARLTGYEFTVAWSDE